MGETDSILDMAAEQKANFDEVCTKMKELNGVPARDFDRLKNKSWYLKE